MFAGVPIRTGVTLVLVGAALACLGATPAAANVTCDRTVTPGANAVSNLMAALAPGQTGCLRAGLYEEDVELFEGGAPGAPVTLRPYPGERAELKGRLLVGKGANHVVVEGLHLNGDNPDRVPSPIIGGDDVVFRNNDVTNHHTSICFAIGSSERADWGRPQRPVIEGNKIHNCGKLPANNHEHGIYAEATDHARIANNWIYDNADRGIQLYPDAQHITITGNVIDGNGQGIIFSGVDGMSSSHNVVRGNVITNSKLRHNVESWWPESTTPGTGNLVEDNCVHGGAEHNALGGIQLSQIGFTAVGNLAKDPQYVARAEKDFRLSPSSPCQGVLAGAGVPGVEGETATVAPPAAPALLRWGTRRVATPGRPVGFRPPGRPTPQRSPSGKGSRRLPEAPARSHQLSARQLLAPVCPRHCRQVRRAHAQPARAARRGPPRAAPGDRGK